MIVRIVRLKFKEEEKDSFRPYFDSVCQYIRGFKGCSKLEVLQQIDQPNTFITYSYWESEEDLNRYRQSEKFKEIWGTVKSKFEEKAQAWSHHKISEL